MDENGTVDYLGLVVFGLGLGLSFELSFGLIYFRIGNLFILDSGY